MRVQLFLVLFVSSMALNFEASLMSHSLEELSNLDTSQLNCQTPQSHFNDLQQSLQQWQNILENQDKISDHISTLTEMKKLIKHKKYTKLVDRLKTLDLVSPPILSEIESKLAGLSSHDAQEKKECEATLMKLCAYLISQMTNVRQQCQTNPITVIKVKGQIDDIKIIQSGCQSACQPNCEDEPEDEPVPNPNREIAAEETPEETEETVIDSEEETSEEGVPASEEESVVPASEEENVVPASEEEDVIPASEEENVVPASEEEDVVPASEEEDVVPASEEENVPASEEENVVPASEEENVPASEEEAVPASEEEGVPASEEEDVIPASEEEAVPASEEEAVPASEEENTEENVPESEEEEADVPPSEEGLPASEEETVPASEEEEVPTPSEEEGVVPESEEQEVPASEEESVPQEEESEPEPEVPRECHSSGVTDLHDLKFSDTEHVFESTVTIDSGSYGFGLYFKWLSHYPETSDASKYFLARLSDGTNNVLSVYLTAEGVQFVTKNEDSGTEEHINAEFEDVEGDWAHLYFSFKNGKAVGVVQYFEEQAVLRQLSAKHSEHTELTFQVGGSDGEHPSFQGKIYGAYAVSGQAHVASLEQYEKYVKACNHGPEDVCERQTENYGDFEFFGQETIYDAANAKAVSTWGDEYSVSGWFKWSAIEDQDVWHSVFRLSSNKVSSQDSAMGDRDLALFVGSEMVRSTLQFTTYTYTEFKGEGNPNLWQTLPYDDQLTKWHFIYFGYNRYERQAYVFVQFASHEATLQFEDINHFVIPEKVLYIGQDEFYPSYSGVMQNIHFNGCGGSFSKEPKIEVFGYVPEPEEPEEPVEPEPTPDPEHESEEEVVSEEELVEEVIPEAEEDPIPESEEEQNPVSEEEQTPEPEEETHEPQPEPTPEEEEPTPEEEETPPEEVPPTIPDEVKPEPKPEPKPSPPEVVPLQPKGEGECENTIDVTKENAADILCALSEYLAQLAAGHEPDLGVNPARVCFCLDYASNGDDGSFMQIEQLLKKTDVESLEHLVIQRRRL